jgi:hypothetical protein
MSCADPGVSIAVAAAAMQQQQQRRRCGSAAAAAPEVGLFDGVDVVATSSFIYALSGDSKLLAEGNEWLLQKRDGTLFVHVGGRVGEVDGCPLRAAVGQDGHAEISASRWVVAWFDPPRFPTTCTGVRTIVAPTPSSSGAEKRLSFEPVYAKTDHFSKTGSGQA